MRTRALVVLVLLLPGIVSAEAALYLSPEQVSPEVGKPFEIRVYADAGGHDVNAAEATLTYDPALVRVVSVSKEGSLASSWSSEPTVSEGRVDFSAWLGARYSGTQGLLLTVVFEPVRVGQGGIVLASGTLLAADVQETNVITRMRSTSFTTSPAQVIPPAPAPLVPATPVDTQATSAPLVIDTVLPPVPAATTSAEGQTAAVAASSSFWQFSLLAVVLAACAGFALAWLGYRAEPA